MFLSLAVPAVLLIYVALRFWWKKQKSREHAVGFFHPYAKDGGGGERVLWCAVRAIQQEAPTLDCVIYTGDDATPDDLAARSLGQFGVKLLSPPKVVKLQRRRCIEASTYPHFTLIGQSLGSIILGLEALSKLTPLIFFDTTGYAFTYPVARIFGCEVACYTHYPTISSDMVARVLVRTSTYNNSAVIAKSFFLSLSKAIYYWIMTVLYGLVGQCAHLAMVNSSWTQAHIEKLWRMPGQVVRVYPPCDTCTLQALPLSRNADCHFFISVAQFRPEKAHNIQLQAFAEVLRRVRVVDKLEEALRSPVRLKLVGSCRHKEDEDRVEKLKLLCLELGIEDRVDFHINVPYRELVELLGGAIGGLHSMIDEHFGIVVVEYMAAGAIPIAHDSAGPKLDIVIEEEGQRTGFLATSVDDYAVAMIRLLGMAEEERFLIASAARKRAQSFSEDKFDADFKKAMSSLLLKASKLKV